MEEDIELLKELKVELENMSITGPTSEDRLNTHRKSLAIENILNELERLQKENEELQEEIMENDLKVIGAEEYTEASMREIIENYYTANEDCIPKQAIRDKIKKLKNEFDFYAGREHAEWQDGEFDGDVCDDLALQIKVLKELLGE